MNDSFRVRVDKVFGSLTEPSNLSSLWCLTDDEIEKREWNRDTPSRDLLAFDSKPCPPHIDGFFSKPKETLDFPKQLQSDLQHLSDGQEQDDDDESDIRSGIGLDCTLDYEEEEDEFDKVAVDREKEKHQPSDRLYTREVSDYGISADTDHELPLTLQDNKRDPRANHEAAKLRLKEDAEAALRVGHLGSMSPAASKPQGQDDAHSPKKLKFSKEDNNLFPNSSIPDYIRNPSKYTCYTLDVSDDMDEESNRKAYMDFLGLMKKQSQLDDGSSFDFQKSPTFNMKMKQPAGTFTKQGVEAEQMHGKKTVTLSIVNMESDNAAMEEDESSVAADRARPGGLHKPGKRYRTREMILASSKFALTKSSREKQFLYDIVANGRNGIDVDKFDYIVRDSRACALGCNFQFQRLMETMRVLGDEICYRAKDYLTIHKLFATRADLHRTVYTHAKVKAMELMIVDALVKANDYLQIASHIEHPSQYWKLDDTILKTIETAPDPELKESRDLILRIRRRDLYQFCNEYAVPRDKIEHFKDVTAHDIVCSQKSSSEMLNEEDVAVSNVRIDLTRGRHNPLESIHFFKDYESDEKFSIPDDRISHLLPSSYQDMIVRVYSKKPHLVETISEAFENFQLKTYGIKTQVHATPEKKKRRI